MRVTDEPVRGSHLPLSAFNLSGVEILRGWGAGWLPYPPFTHLVGQRGSQSAVGSVTLVAPVSGWLTHPDGSVDAVCVGTNALTAAALSIAEPGRLPRCIHASFNQARRVDADARRLVTRANVVRSSHSWCFVEGTTEMDDGRVVGTMAGHYSLDPVSFEVPAETPPRKPLPAPSFPSPDPYARAVPGDRLLFATAWSEKGGMAALSEVAEGTAPTPAMHELFGLRVTAVAPGSSEMALTASDWLTDMTPTLSTAVIASIATDSAGACSWTLLGPGQGREFHLLHLDVLYAKAVRSDAGEIRFRSSSSWVADDLISSTCEVMAGPDRFAVATTRFRVLPNVASAAPAGAHRVLASVLFTDIVESTEAVRAVGDDAWGRLLQEHQRVSRDRLDEFGGWIVKSTGDGVLATFDSPTRAVECARAISVDVERLGIQLRCGIHTGEVEVSAGDIAGIAVHLAARVEALAGPGEVVVTETTRMLTEGSSLSFEGLGEHSLKGVDGTVRLHRLCR